MDRLGSGISVHGTVRAGCKLMLEFQLCFPVMVVFCLEGVVGYRGDLRESDWLQRQEPSSLCPSLSRVLCARHRAGQQRGFSESSLTQVTEPPKTTPLAWPCSDPHQNEVKPRKETLKTTRTSDPRQSRLSSVRGGSAGRPHTPHRGKEAQSLRVWMAKQSPLCSPHFS